MVEIFPDREAMNVAMARIEQEAAELRRDFEVLQERHEHRGKIIQKAGWLIRQLAELISEAR